MTDVHTSFEVENHDVTQRWAIPLDIIRKNMQPIHSKAPARGLRVENPQTQTYSNQTTETMVSTRFFLVLLTESNAHRDGNTTLAMLLTSLTVPCVLPTDAVYVNVITSAR